jgi:hypothetical protein
LEEIKAKQKELDNVEELYYPTLSFYTALKYDILFKNLLLHPLVLSKKSVFDEDKYTIKSKEQVKTMLQKVIEYELTESVSHMIPQERDKLIQIFRKLNKPTARKKNGKTETTI